MLGPDLTNVGTPRSAASGFLQAAERAAALSSTKTAASPSMATKPKKSRACQSFARLRSELRALTAYLSVQRGQSSPSRTRSMLASLPRGAKILNLISQGELRFRQMFCSTCHSLAVTRAGETKLIGGEIGPELTCAPGSKVNPDWLIAWLRDPQSYLPHTRNAALRLV